jgi:hypothetical protein
MSVSQSLGVTVNLDLDPWTDLSRDRMPLNTHGLSAGITRVGVMPNGTTGGRATVMFEVRLPDGRIVIAETTLRLFITAAAAIGACPVAQLEDL